MPRSSRHVKGSSKLQKLKMSNFEVEFEGHCEAPCVKFRSQNWDPTSWKSRLKSFQVSVLKTMSWKSYPKISQAPKLRSQVLKIMSWKPYPKISQVFLPGRPALPVRQTDIVDEEKLSEKWLLITSLSGCSLTVRTGPGPSPRSSRRLSRVSVPR